MIGDVMSPAPNRSARWAFWIAGALAAAGGFLPIVVAGTSGRINIATLPFWLGAIAFGASALLIHLGRGLLTVLYLAASLAIVYGILGLCTVLLQQAVLTPCVPGPAGCGVGFMRPLTSAELSGIGYCIGLGTLAAASGFAGLRVVYRQRPARSPQPSPPVRSIAPITTSGGPEPVAEGDQVTGPDPSVKAPPEGEKET